MYMNRDIFWLKYIHRTKKQHDCNLVFLLFNHLNRQVFSQMFITLIVSMTTQVTI